MARSCGLEHKSSYGNKKQQSMLYKRLLDYTMDETKANNLHLLAQQTKYNKLHSNKENLDETEELKFDVFMNQIYFPDVLKVTDSSMLKVTLAEIKEMIHKRIAIINKNLTPDSTLDNRQKRLQVELQILQKLVNNKAVNEAEFVVEFVDRMHSLIHEASEILDNLTTDGVEVNANDVKNLVDIRNEFASMKLFERIESLRKDPEVKKMMDTIDTNRTDENQTTITEKINYILREKAKVERDYIEKGIPLMADWLLKYNPSTINASVNALVNNIKTYKRGKHFIRKDDDYKKLVQEHKDGKLTKDEYDQSIENLAIQQIYDRNLISRSSVIADLKRAYRDKSGFSLFFDPFIYTNDKVLGLFARALKEETYKAAMQSRDTAIEQEKYYQNFIRATGRNPFNAETFNDGLYEEIEIYSLSHKKKIKRLSFIQKFNISLFEGEKDKLYKSLHETTINNLKERNTPITSKISKFTQEKYDEWIQSEEGKAWRDTAEWEVYKNEKKVILAKWFSENTEPTPDAMQKIRQIQKEISGLKAIINELIFKEKAGTITYDEKHKLRKNIVLREDREQWLYTNTINRGINNVIIPKGSLAQPKENKYLNKKYTDLTQNEALFTYYNHLLDQYKTDQKKISKSHLSNNIWEDFIYYLPSVRKNNKDIYIESHGNFISAVKNDIWDALKITDTDTQFGITDETGAQVQTIPVFFTHAVEAQHVSKDIVSSILQFHNMTNEYKAKAKIHSQILLMQDIIDNRETAKTNSLGQAIVDVVAKKFGIDRNVLKKDRSNYSRSLEEFIKLNFYGQKTESMMVGGKYSINKIANKLAMFTGINALAFNALQGVNNMMIGNLLFFTESLSKQYINHKNWLKAQQYFWEGKAGVMDLNRFNAVTKFGQLVEIFDPLQGKYIDKYGKNITGPAMKKAFKMDAIFFLQNGGEFQMQTQTMLAILDATTVKDKDGNIIKKEDGTNLTLYEAYKPRKEDGKIELDSRVTKVQLENNPNFDISVNDIRTIIHGLNGKMHGKYNSFDKSVLQRQWYGQLIMLFRGWIIPGIRRRWGFGGGPNTDFEMGHISEGTYISFFRFVKQSLEDRTLPLATFNTLSDMEKSNVIKTAVEMLALISLIVITKALAGIDTDDDDEELYFIMYQIRRLQADIGFYIRPGEAYRILKSPSATLNMYSKVVRVANQALNPLEEYQRKSGMNEKGDNKLWSRVRDLLPLINNIEKSLTPSESYSWFTQYNVN